MRKLVLPVMFARNSGVYVLREKWDNLIILDACRYDAFEESYLKEGLVGRLESRVSRGTETRSFLRENFGSVRSLPDLVYVSANPIVTQLFKHKFFKIVQVWEDGWDARHQTVLPETMHDRALEAIREYPDKRLIVHFLQPHRPFIDYPYENWWKSKKAGDRFLHVWGSMNERGRSWLTQADRDGLFDLYRRNLQLVLSYVKRLLDVLPGLTVVTSDHGEAFGERIHPLIPLYVYGHPAKTRIGALIKVPWLVVDSPKKKAIRAESKTTESERLPKDEEELINERLSALGYI